MKLLKYNFFNKYIEQRKIGLVIGIIIFCVGFLFDKESEISTVLIVVGAIYSFFSFLFIQYAKKDFAKLDDKIVSEICDNIKNEKFICYDEIGVFATNDYFIDLYSRFEIFKYSDVLWIYLFNEKYFPNVHFHKHDPASFIGVYLKNGEERKVYLNREPVVYYEANKFIDYVKTKNDNIVIGYDKDTRNKMTKKIEDIREKLK